MKKIWFCFSLLAVLLCFACTPNSPQEKIITVTIEPQRYFVQQLVDSLFTIDCMVAPGVSPETYDPTANQLTRLSQSTAYFGIGPIGFELAWLDKLKENNPQLRFYDNSEGVEMITTEHAHGDHMHYGSDPHIWSSPKQALIIVKNMYNALLELDEANAAVYTANYEQLKSEIEAVDREVQSLLDGSNQRAFIIYHPALTYFSQDYGLTQYAIEMEGKEPSALQIKNLINTSKENDVKTIFIQEEFDKKNAELIAKETGCRLVVINPLSYHWSEEVIRIAKSLSDE